MIILPVLIIIFGAFIGAFGAIYLKKGSAMSFRLFYKNKNLLLGLFFFGISTIPFMFAIRMGPLSVLYPFVSISYIFITILSKYLLKEKITKYKILGILFIIVGVTLIGLGH